MASAKVANRVAKLRRSGSVKKEPDPPSPEGASTTKDAFSLDDLEILTTIGTGTFGRVVLTRHSQTRKYYALKMMAISEVIRLKQVEHVQNEKNILNETSHPFIVNVQWTHHDPTYLYMLMEFVPGGELFTYLRNSGRFPTSYGIFYSAEIVSALEYLHEKNVVYRDLKPENLLLDRDGHVKVTDFGFAKKLDDRTWTLCGTPEYLAPEIIQSKGHNSDFSDNDKSDAAPPSFCCAGRRQKQLERDFRGGEQACDWWALGILIFEMLVGYPPFFDDNPFGIYEKILAGKIEWPKHLDPITKDLIKKLLVHDRTKRLGNMKNGANDVKFHRFFRGISWDDVYQRKLQAPIVPKVTHEGDTRNFETYPEADKKIFSSVSEKDLEPFSDF